MPPVMRNVEKTYMWSTMHSSALQIYAPEDIMQGKIDLLSNTNMVDFAKEVYMSLHPDSEDGPQCKFS